MATLNFIKINELPQIADNKISRKKLVKLEVILFRILLFPDF